MGLFSAINRSRYRNRRLVILGFHSVSAGDEFDDMPGLRLSPATFERRLQHLAGNGYRVLTLGEGLSRLFSNTLPPRSVVLTFDDGFADFHTIALPILRRYSVPATLYLTTFYCEFNRPVFDLACRYILSRSRREWVAPHASFGWDVPPDLSTHAGRWLAWRRLENQAHCDRRSAAGKEELVAELAQHCGVSYCAILRSRLHYLMTPDQVADCARAGVAIELHTHRHRTPHNERLFRREIEENRARILEYTGITPRHFCYPSGYTDAAFVPWLRQLAVESATTCAPGMASRTTQPLLVPRYLDADDCSDTVFESWLVGFDDALRAATASRVRQRSNRAFRASEDKNACSATVDQRA